jgi:hypothetical protein
LQPTWPPPAAARRSRRRSAVAAAQTKAAATGGGGGSSSAAADAGWSLSTHLSLMELALPALLAAPASDVVWAGPAGVRRFYAMAAQGVHYILRYAIPYGIGSMNYGNMHLAEGLAAYAAADPALRCTAVEGDPLWTGLKQQLLNIMCHIAVGEGEPALDADAVVADVPSAVAACLASIKGGPPALVGPGLPANIDGLTNDEFGHVPLPAWAAAAGGAYAHPLGVLWPGDPDFEGEV